MEGRGIKTCSAKVTFKRAFGGNYMMDPEDGCQLQKAEAPFLLLASLLVVALGIQPLGLFSTLW